MILLHQDATDEKLVVTLSELTTIPNANYLFVFEREVTGTRVVYLVTPSDDESDATFRYNQYAINTASVFSGKPVGRYVYRVYEQAGTSLSEAGLDLIEQGICEVLAPEESIYTAYNTSVVYKTYNS